MITKEPVTILLDSDIVAYQFASKSQSDFKWPNGTGSQLVLDLKLVVHDLDKWIDKLMKELKADDIIVCLSCPSSEGFRKKVLPSYKENRSGVTKPVLLEPIKEYLTDNYKTLKRDTLEADDVMGILSTHPKLVKGKKIIVSEDKDMKTIPGWLYNPAKDLEPWLVSESEADYWHLYQTLAGDTTDWYKGCPGIGKVKAESLLKASPLENYWKVVVDTFKSKGLTEEDALVQARVARILRASDYNFMKKEVNLWTPQVKNVTTV